MKDKMLLTWSNLSILTAHKHGVIRWDGKQHYVDEIKLRKFAEMISNGGFNSTRVLHYAFWKYDGDELPIHSSKEFQPYYWNDKKMLWDLSKFNTKKWYQFKDRGYFKVVREVIRIFNEYNIQVWFSLFDNCQLHNPFKTPWKNNVQGIKSFYYSDKFSLQFVDRCIKEFKGLDICYEIGNEITNEGASMDRVKNWGRAILHRLIEKGIPHQKICFGAVMHTRTSEYEEVLNEKTGKKEWKYTVKAKSLLSWLKKSESFKPVELYGGNHGKAQVIRPVHGCGSWRKELPDNIDNPAGWSIMQALFWWGNHPIRIWFSTDGTKDAYSDSCDTDGNKHRPGVKRWGEMLAALNKYKFKWPGEDIGSLINIENRVGKKATFDCQKKIMQFIVKWYKNKFGQFPYNKRFPTTIIPEESEIPEIPEIPEIIETKETFMKKLLIKMFGESAMIVKHPWMFSFIIPALTVGAFFALPKWFWILIVLYILYLCYGIYNLVTK